MFVRELKSCALALALCPALFFSLSFLQHTKNKFESRKTADSRAFIMHICEFDLPRTTLT